MAAVYGRHCSFCSTVARGTPAAAWSTAGRHYAVIAVTNFFLPLRLTGVGRLGQAGCLVNCLLQRLHRGQGREATGGHYVLGIRQRPSLRLHISLCCELLAACHCMHVWGGTRVTQKCRLHQWLPSHRPHSNPLLRSVEVARGASPGTRANRIMHPTNQLICKLLPQNSSASPGTRSTCSWQVR